MKLKHYLSTPKTYGQIVDDYLKVLKVNEEYSAWTINDELEVVSCKGIIENNGSWNYHNNYDDSENELYAAFDGLKVKQWFTLNKDEAIKIQQENIKKWKLTLNKELNRIDTISCELKNT